MKIGTHILTAAVAVASLLAPVAAVAAPSQDEQIRRLDIMLMVTSLRCRTGAHNFQPHYQAFSAKHLSTLNAAGKRLEQGLVGQYGAKGAVRALDKISVSMANQYGQGHPWLGCHELKKVATDLAGTSDPAALTRAANELLAAAPPASGRLASR